MAISATREQRRQLERDNAKQPESLKEIPRESWPTSAPAMLRVLRSRSFLVQEYREQDKGVLVRLSVCRTSISGDRWQDGISWEELQKLKRECGYGDRDAVEVFPADVDVVNVANMRHIFIMAGPVAFAWRKRQATTSLSATTKY